MIRLRYCCVFVAYTACLACAVTLPALGSETDSTHQPGHAQSANFAQDDHESSSDTAESEEASVQWSRAIAADDTFVLSNMLSQYRDAGLSGLRSATGKTALMAAAKTGDLSLAQDLVRRGANPTEVTLTGGTAMMFAALGDSIELARWLLQQGAAVDSVGSNGWAAVTIAAARGYGSMLEWLLSVDAPAAPIDVYGYTPLMRAVENGYAETTGILLDAGAVFIDHQDELGNTALHHAIRQGRDDLVELLRMAGADDTITNLNGQLAVESAR